MPPSKVPVKSTGSLCHVGLHLNSSGGLSLKSGRFFNYEGISFHVEVHMYIYILYCGINSRLFHWPNAQVFKVGKIVYVWVLHVCHGMHEYKNIWFKNMLIFRRSCGRSIRHPFCFRSQCRCFCVQNPGITMDLRISWEKNGQPEKGPAKKMEKHLQNHQFLGIHSNIFIYCMYVLSKNWPKKNWQRKTEALQKVTVDPTLCLQAKSTAGLTNEDITHSPTQPGGFVENVTRPKFNEQFAPE